MIILWPGTRNRPSISIAVDMNTITPQPILSNMVRKLVTSRSREREDTTWRDAASPSHGCRGKRHRTPTGFEIFSDELDNLRDRMCRISFTEIPDPHAKHCSLMLVTFPAAGDAWWVNVCTRARQPHAK
jgi:hypothetical protein